MCDTIDEDAVLLLCCVKCLALCCMCIAEAVSDDYYRCSYDRYGFFNHHYSGCESDRYRYVCVRMDQMEMPAMKYVLDKNSTINWMNWDTWMHLGRPKITKTKKKFSSDPSRPMYIGHTTLPVRGKNQKIYVKNNKYEVSQDAFTIHIFNKIPFWKRVFPCCYKGEDESADQEVPTDTLHQIDDGEENHELNESLNKVIADQTAAEEMTPSSRGPLEDERDSFQANGSDEKANNKQSFIGRTSEEMPPTACEECIAMKIELAVLKRQNCELRSKNTALKEEHLASQATPREEIAELKYIVDVEQLKNTISCQEDAVCSAQHDMEDQQVQVKKTDARVAKEAQTKLIAERKEQNIKITPSPSGPSQNWYDFLPTAIVNIQSECNEVQGGIMFDSGSQCSFITPKMAKLLKLEPIRQENHTLKDFDGHADVAKDYDVVQFSIIDLHGHPIPIEAMVDPISVPFFDRHRAKLLSLPHLKSLKVAHPFSEEGRFEADILIGVDYYWNIVGDGVVRGPGPTAVDSRIGYLIFGPLNLA